MKFFDDILESISGNTRTKVEDPFIGAFIGSWIVCNWHHLAMLIWGDGTAAERINSLSSYFRETSILGLTTIFTIPLCMTLLYLFAFPWISLLLKSGQKFANEQLHRQAISIEISKVKQQEVLNKQKLLADPDKKFLEQNAQIDIDRRKEIVEQLRLRSIRRKEQAEATIASAAEAKSRANQAEMDEERKQKKAELERQQFSAASAQLKSAQASNRFPSSYTFMLAIDESLKSDGIQLSLNGLGEIVALVFGYEDFHSLIHDENFNNETISKVSYIYYDPKELASGLEVIVHSEESNNEDLGPDILFDNVLSTFESLNLKLLTEDQAGEVCRDICEGLKYDLLNSNEFSGPMAESDTIFEEIEIGDLDSIIFNNGLSITFTGSASGSHRKEHDISGRDIEFSIEIKSTVLVGKKALGKFESGEISASLVDYDDYGETEAY